MKKLLVLLALLATLVAPAAAVAHPLGNFSTNRFTRLEVSGNRLYALYVLDLAEIPTYQARGELRRLGRERYGAALSRRVRANLRLVVDGERLTPREVRRTLSFPRGAGGLPTTRLELVLDAGRLDADTADVSYEDRNYPGRIGWREVVVRGSDGASVLSSSAPARSVSGELRSYPADRLASPLDVSRAHARVSPGTAGGVAPASAGPREEADEDGFAALVDDDLSAGVVLVSLLIALFWGAAHALTPGHGKAIVAAYLVGTRGTARQAFALGGIVTVAHTVGVFALGLVTLSLSEFVVPETLFPWLNLAAALLVVGVGAAVLRARARDWRHGRAHARGHHHDHHHHDHEHHGHGHHHHAPAPGSGVRGLVAVGISGGLLPCPTALVVLLAAISLHRVAYGLVLIVAFSFGLAAVITGIGLLAVGAKRTFGRMSFDGRLVRALPAVSALVIVALGIAMTARSLPPLV